ncbi:MAG: hypothetical protein ABIJ18_03925 [archaeon]
MATGDKKIDALIQSNQVLQSKIENLTDSTRELIEIFRSAGEHIKSGKYEDPMINKINELLEQNRNLAHALKLLEDYVKKKTGSLPEH